MPPMTRRRSARLASASQMPSGSTAPQTLASLAEGDEPSEPVRLDGGRAVVPPSPSVQAPRTPASSSPLKPPRSEMHPSKSYSVPEPPSTALRFGFVDIPTSNRNSPVKQNVNTHGTSASPEAEAAMLQATPSKVAAAPPTSDFTFRFTRHGDEGSDSHDMGLSEEARRMMEELREEALKIRADLEVQRDQERAKEADGEYDEINGRRIAKPKSRAGRFSAAHSAAFQKMDSIANHPSAFRAAAGRFTPVKASPSAAAAAPLASASSHKRGLKRTQSKANLDDTPKQAKSSVVAAAPQSAAKKRSNLLFSGSSSSRSNDTKVVPMSAAKRARQHLDDDASSRRPISRDGSGLPRPTTATSASASAAGKDTPAVQSRVIAHAHTTASLMTPTKASLARAAGVKTPGSGSGSGSHQAKSPSPTKSVTTNSFYTATTSVADRARQLFGAVGGRSHRSETSPQHAPANTTVKRCALPVPAVSAASVSSKTPAPPRLNKTLPRLPATTPRRKLVKQVAFTPTTQRAILSVESPSLCRSAIPRSTSRSNLRSAAAEPHGQDSTTVAAAVQESPSTRHFGRVLYPDLSKHHLLRGLDKKADAASSTDGTDGADEAADPAVSAPGTFTFRSDKTIHFGPVSPTGFGSSPGQSSVRQVRPSTAPTMIPSIPGSFPGSSLFSALVATQGANKENTQPMAIKIPHGIANKKRHRVSAAEDDAEREAADRAAKKRKNQPVPEGEALLAPRLVGKGCTGSVHATPRKQLPHSTFGRTPSKTPGSTKKRPVLSMSRLNSLARPKVRN